MGLDMTEFDAALKQHYTRERVENMVYADNPLFAMLSKMTDFGGKNLPLPLIYGNPQGRSASFSRAQTRGQVTSSKITDFVLTRVKNYSIATIDNETLEASKGDANAFLQAATVEIDGAINALTRDMAIDMYRSGYGEKGQIGSISTDKITLKTLSDVTNFEVGQELEVAATLSGALRANGSSGNGLIITGINRSTGVLTFGYGVTDATNGIPLAAADDYIFVRGDHQSGVMTKLAGLEAWLPASAPGSTLFFGVDRSVDVTRLAGQRLSASGMPIEEALYEGAAMTSAEGRKLTHYFMNFTKYSELEKSLGGKVQYVDMNVGQIGFRGIQINGPKGPINVVPDQNCPGNRVFGLELPLWKLYSLGEPVRVIDTDGLQMLRQATADGVECRYGSYSQIGSRGPAGGINIQL